MIYQSGRNIFQVEIHHLIGTDDHCALLVVKSFYNPGNNIVINVKVITVELNGKLAALFAKNSFIPASSDTKIKAFRDDVINPGIGFGKRLYYIGGTVG